MHIVCIESEAYKNIMDRLENIEKCFMHFIKQQPLSDTLLDVDETCKLLKISKRTLQNYRDDGLLSYTQIGSKIYFRAADIDEFLKRHTRKVSRKYYKPI